MSAPHTDEQQILDALRVHYRMAVERIEFLRAGGSRSYVVSAGDRRYLLKVINRAFLDTIRQSVDVLRYLAQHGFPAPRTLETRDGQAILTLADGDPACALIVYEFIDGIEPSVAERAVEIGELTGRLHATMRGYSSPLPVRGKPFFIDRYIGILRAKRYPEAKLREYVALGDTLWDKIRDLPYGFCHGDLHAGNLLSTAADNLYILDFDTACYAPRMFDVMVMCDTTNYFTLAPTAFDAATRVYQQLLSGYARYSPLSDAEIGSFHEFVAVRHYQLQATIVEMHDPDCIDERFIDRQLDWLRSWRRHYS
ncbi:MAG: phosphotransferase [Chloroflexi bacterium]|nr:phosphotransferase [Chloroflexota bacterium]